MLQIARFDCDCDLDSNRESQITSDLRDCDPSQKSSMYWLVVQEFGIAILTAIWTEVQITNRAIWKCDLSFPSQRFGKFLRFGPPRFQITSNLWFGALRSWPILCQSGQVLHSKVLEQLVFGRRLLRSDVEASCRVPNFCLALCGLPKQNLHWINSFQLGEASLLTVGAFLAYGWASLLTLGDKIQGPSWGQQKRRKRKGLFLDARFEANPR